MAQLSLSFLGSWQVLLLDGTAPRFKYDKVRALLAYLAVESGRPHRREVLMDMLWPDLPESAARNNLRQALASLREAVGDRYAANPFLLVNRASVQFNPGSDYSLDLHEFTALLERTGRHLHRRPESCRSCIQLMQQAADLYRGTFLADFYLSDSIIFEEWATLKREWLHQQALAILGRLADYHEQKGQHNLALQYVWRQLDLDLWQEQAHRQAMRLYALSGDRQAALAQYQKCCRILSEEMGVEPEEETTALYEQIQNEDALYSSPHPTSPKKGSVAPFAIPAAKPNNLLPQATPFLDREAELSEIGRLLDETPYRLITLTGPGGSGKTRLAVQAAAENLDSFADGAFFISLAPLQSADLLPTTISDILGLEPSQKEDHGSQLLSYLREKEMLLVLDSFEHLMGGAGFLSDLLKHAPEVALLVSSRERLNLHGEYVFSVEGLQPPDPAASFEMLSENAAVQLFVNSAQRVRRTFSLDPGNMLAVARICTLTAGLPLAIELAAAWVRALSCHEIAEEIGRGIGILTTNLRDVPERHRSLAAVFDHSWCLLSSEERRVLGDLAVFQGGFSRISAEAVAGASPSLLASLVDKSLLRRNPLGRYEIHEMVRQYVEEKMDAAGDLDAVRARHAAHFLSLVEEAEPHLVGPEQASWLARLQDENDNLRAALHASLEAGNVDTAGRIGGAVWRFWQTHGHVSEGRDWLERILESPEKSLPVDVRASVLKAAGVMAWLQGDYDCSQERFEAGLSLYEQEGNLAGVATLLGNLGTLAIHRTEYEEARALMEKALALRRELDDRWGIASCLNNMGALAGRQGDIVRAQACYQECLDLFRELGYKSGIGISLSNLGSAAGDLGDYTRAYLLHMESLAVRRELGDKTGIAYSLSDLGNLAYQQGKMSQACAHFVESLQLLQELGDKEHIVECLEGLGQVASSREEIEKAARVWGAAESLREAMNAPMPQGSVAAYRKHVSQARSRIAAGSWDEAWEQGRRMALDQTIAWALEFAREQIDLIDRTS